MRFRKWGIALSNKFAEKIRIFDTTLRDGEQTPGVALTPEQKLKIAKKLDELGVNAIEAGFAAATKGEFEAVKMIAKENLRAEIFSFARGTKEDIDAVIESGASSVFLVIPSSEAHIKYKLKKRRVRFWNSRKNASNMQRIMALRLSLELKMPLEAKFRF